MVRPVTLFALCIAMVLCSVPVSAITAVDDCLTVYPSDWPEDPSYDNRINLLENDIPDSDPLFVEIIEGPRHASGDGGYWTLLDDGTVYYEPGRCTYEDTILYRACDGISCSGVATLAITANLTNPYFPQPDGIHTTYPVLPDTPLFVENGVAFGSGIWQYRVLSWPGHGSITEPGGFFLCLTNDCDFTMSIPDGWQPSFTFTPDPAFTGVDKFTYCIMEDTAMFGYAWGKPGTVTFSVGDPIPLPGYTSPPGDPDGDGFWEDLNGNGRMDFADVVLLFDHMDWIEAHEPIAAFDLNANGRVDFADVVALFNEI